jgi:hypothetical protein
MRDINKDKDVNVNENKDTTVNENGWINMNIGMSKYFNKIMDVILNYLYKDDITFCDLMKGLYYKFLHGIYIYFIMFMMLFSTNLYHLTLVLFMIMLNAFAVVVRQRCPLSEFEEKYMKESAYLTRQKILKFVIACSCEHEYESTVEMLLNAWCIISLKCLLIMILKTCNIQIVNCNNIYCV